MKTLRLSGSTSKVSERDIGGLRFDLILDRFPCGRRGNWPSSVRGRQGWPPALATLARTLNQMLPKGYLRQWGVQVSPLLGQNGTQVADRRFQTQSPRSSRMSLTCGG